jgi:Na+-translocating ferredoxin:NAD+ oxidoreductase RnfG subunit
MKYYFSCLLLGIISCSSSGVVASAKQPVTNGIGDIQNKKEIQGCGCSLQQEGKPDTVFWSELNRKSARINIDGKDRILKLVSETPSSNREKKGDRSTSIYRSGKINVRIDLVVNSVCRQGDQECEATGYDGKIKLNVGNRQQIISVTGGCGC